jgi:hypothetical protein
MTPHGHLFDIYGYSNQDFHIFLATDLTVGNTQLDTEEAGLITRWSSEAEVWQLIATAQSTANICMSGDEEQAHARACQ